MSTETHTQSQSTSGIACSDLQGEAPNQKWIIEGWLPEGKVTTLCGDGAPGKSLLAVMLGEAISQGKPFVGLPVTTPMPVLGLFTEDSEDELHRRLYSAQYFSDNADSATDEQLYDYRLWSRNYGGNTLVEIGENGECRHGPFFGQLIAELNNMGPAPKLLILDTLLDLLVAPQDARKAISKFIKVVLGDICRDHNCTVLLVGDLSSFELSTSITWTRDAQNCFILRHMKPFRDYRVLICAKSGDDQPGTQINLKLEDNTFKVVNPAEIYDEEEAKK